MNWCYRGLRESALSRVFVILIVLDRLLRWTGLLPRNDIHGLICELAQGQ